MLLKRNLGKQFWTFESFQSCTCTPLTYCIQLPITKKAGD